MLLLSSICLSREKPMTHNGTRNTAGRGIPEPHTYIPNGGRMRCGAMQCARAVLRQQLIVLLKVALCLTDRSGEPLESVHKFGHVALVLVDVEGCKYHGVLVSVPAHDHLRLRLAHHTHVTQVLEQILHSKHQGRVCLWNLHFAAGLTSGRK